MTLCVLKLGIVAARRAPCGEWAHESLTPVAALPDVPDVEPWSVLGGSAGPDGPLLYVGEAELELHSAATAHYRDNLQSRAPSLWIAMEPEGARWRVRCVTADPYEGEALAETAADMVEAVAMPHAVCDEVARFIEAYHVERPFVKRERTR